MRLKQGRNIAYYAKGLLGLTLAKHSNIKSDQLLVVNYHGTQLHFLDNFRRQLDFWQKNFCIITPAEIDRFGESDQIKPKLLLTFDDGIKNNLYAAEELDKRGLKGLFFIIPAFIDNASKTYFIQNIRPKPNPLLDKKLEDFTPLSWLDLIEICQKNHQIGNHSMTHNLSYEMDYDSLTTEIIESKQIIERKMNLNDVKHFCSPNNSITTLNQKAVGLIKAHYRYHFSTVCGVNTILSETSHHLIYRVNIEAFWGIPQLKFAISDFEQHRWKMARNQFTQFYSL